MKNIFHIFLAFFLSTLFACQPKVSQNKIDQIDQLSARLDSAQARLMQVDSAKAFRMVNTYEENLQFLQQDLKDTLPRKMAFFVDSYYRMRKAIRKFGNSYPNLKDEITITQRQLEDLKTDAENDLLEEKQFDEYLEVEKENSETIINATHSILDKMDIVMPLYEKKNPRIDSIITAYKTKQDKSS